MKKISLLTFVFTFILLSSMVGRNVTSLSLADTSVSATPGDTIYFTSNAFFVDLEKIAGEDFPTGMTPTIDIAGSQIYAKVIDTQEVTGSYQDPITDTEKTIDTTVVDIAVGAILGKDLPFNDGNGTDITFPSGMGLGLPFLFSSHTDFGFYSDSNNLQAQLPIPLFLNNDWTRHEVVITAAFSDGGSDVVSVVNDAAQFAIDISDAPLETYDDDTDTYITDAYLDAHVSWDKSNNLISTAKLTITGADDDAEWVNIDFAFESKTNVGIEVSVGDVINFGLADFNLDVTLEGDAMEAQDGLDELNSQMADVLAFGDLAQLVVLETSGLYYRVSVGIYNTTTGELMPQGDTWMVGFGRLGYGMVAGTNAAVVEPIGTQQVQGTTIGSAVSGPIVTPEYNLFEAWDKSVAFAADTLEQSVNEIFDTIVSEAGEEVIAFDANFEISYTYGGSYEYGSTTTADVEFITNTTNEYYDHYDYENNVDVYVTYWEYTHVIAEMTATEEVAYNAEGHLQTIDFSGDGSFEMTQSTNNTEWGSESSGKITVNDFKASFEVTYDLRSSGQESSSTEDTNPSPLPFATPFILIASFAIAVVIYKRKFN